MEISIASASSGVVSLVMRRSYGVMETVIYRFRNPFPPSPCHILETDTLRHRFRNGTLATVEVIGRRMQRWPDPDEGPLQLCIIVGLVDGRPEAVGVEIWGVNPAELPRWVTGMTPEQVERKWILPPVVEDPSGIRTVDLRLPLGRIVEEVTRASERTAGYLQSDRAKRQGGWVAKAPVQSEARRITKAVESTQPKAPGRPGRRPLPRSHYVEVANVYRAALRRGENPTQAVMERWVVSKSQASKWIYRCRRPPLNLLDATSRGRPAAGTPKGQSSKRKGST